MASAAEALGMTIPGSSSFPADSKEKREECATIGGVMHNLLAKNILPRDIMTRSAFENAMVHTWPSAAEAILSICFSLTGVDHGSRRLH